MVYDFYLFLVLKLGNLFFGELNCMFNSSRGSVGYMWVSWCTSKSENNFWEMVLSFHYVSAWGFWVSGFSGLAASIWYSLSALKPLTVSSPLAYHFPLLPLMYFVFIPFLCSLFDYHDMVINEKTKYNMDLKVILSNFADNHYIHTVVI